MAYSAGYKYAKTHEWVGIEGSTGSVGITDYAQSSLGDIVFVELPKVGDTLQAGKIFGTVESVKAVSDLYAPVSGKVTEVNDALQGAPETINADADTTWLYRFEMADPGELTALDTLLDAVQYEQFVKEETGH